MADPFKQKQKSLERADTITGLAKEVLNKKKKPVKFTWKGLTNLSTSLFSTNPFDKLKLDKGKKSKTGAWQTSVSILEDLSNKGHEIADLLLDWRHFSKLKSTYSKALIEQINIKTKRTTKN